MKDFGMPQAAGSRWCCWTLSRVYPQQESPAWPAMMSCWSGGMEKDGSSTHVRQTETQLRHLKSNLSSIKQTDRQKAATCIIPEDNRDWIMALAWPSFQPITLLRTLRAPSMSWGFIIVIWPVDKPVLSLPRAEMAVASMLSPRLPAKAAPTYRGKSSNFVRCSYILCKIEPCLYFGIPRLVLEAVSYEGAIFTLLTRTWSLIRFPPVIIDKCVWRRAWLNQKHGCPVFQIFFKISFCAFINFMVEFYILWLLIQILKVLIQNCQADNVYKSWEVILSEIYKT